jgi:hypothetical protein
MMGLPGSEETQAELRRLLGFVTAAGMSDQNVGNLKVLSHQDGSTGSGRGRSAK